MSTWNQYSWSTLDLIWLSIHIYNKCNFLNLPKFYNKNHRFIIPFCLCSKYSGLLIIKLFRVFSFPGTMTRVSELAQGDQASSNWKRYLFLYHFYLRLSQVDPWKIFQKSRAERCYIRWISFDNTISNISSSAIYSWPTLGLARYLNIMFQNIDGNISVES